MTELNQANICEFCNKSFSTKSNCTKHKITCKIKKNKELTDSIVLKDIIKQKDEEISKNYTEIKQKEEQIKFLKSMIESLSNKPTNVSYNNCNNVNNNLSIKQIVSKLDPINFKDVKHHMGNFTSSYQDQGTEGFAKFLCDHPFKDKFITTDYSRNTIAYKTKEQDFVRDPESTYLISRTLKENKEDIIDSSKDRLNFINNKIKKSTDEDDTEIYCSKKLNIKKLIDTTENIDSTKINDKDMSSVFRSSGVITYQNLIESKEITNENESSLE